MLRLLAALAVLVLSAPASAGPLSRWADTGLTGLSAIHAAGTDVVALVALRGNQQPLRSFDGGVTWTPFLVDGYSAGNSLYDSWWVVSASDQLTWYAIRPDGTPVLTRDGGNTWTGVALSDFNRSSVALGAVPGLLYTVERKPDGFLGTPRPSGILRSQDFGATWTRLESAPTTAERIVTSIADPNVVFAFGFRVHRSDDRGGTWRDVTPSLVGTSMEGPFMDLALDRRDANIAYLAYWRFPQDAAGRRWTSIDGGVTWIQDTTLGAVTFVADPRESRRAYRFTFEGVVHETRDAGRTWVKAQEADGVGVTQARLVMGTAGGRIAVGIGHLTNGRLRAIDLTEGALALGSDLWWNPAQSGTGVTITQHASNGMFVVWYAYDATGKQVWRVMPGGTWHDRIITGTLYETEGPPYFQDGSFDPSRVASRAVGVATIDFRDQDNATITFGSGSGTVFSRAALTRQLFGEPARATPENFADIWYNAAESGWGIGISHQGDRIFATWYVYGTDGKPLWIVMPDSVLATEFAGVVRQVARGDIYTTAIGPGGQVVTERVGSARIVFRSLGSADLEYTAFGKTATVAITRQPF